MVLFLDLVKAFDKAIRQIVYGWSPQHLHLTPAQKAEFLVSSGVDLASAQWIVQYIDEAGCVMQRWRADPKATEMAESLHANAWFTSSDEAPAATTSTGGRQGCKLGALTFNSHYAVALDAITQRLAGEGIALRMCVPSGPFWHPESGSDDVEVFWMRRSLTTKPWPSSLPPLGSWIERWQYYCRRSLACSRRCT